MQSECGAGDTGLEIAPGSEAENAEALIADPGNIWNGVPQVLPSCTLNWSVDTCCFLTNLYAQVCIQIGQNCSEECSE